MEKVAGQITTIPAPIFIPPDPLIYQLMGKVLAELPAIGKDSVNEQQRFKFRSIDAALNALNPILAKHGVFYLPQVLERIGEERQTKSGTSMYVVHLHILYTFYAPDGSRVSADVWGEGTDLGDKATSKAHTMAQKSCLIQAFSIATEDMVDPDGQTAEPTTKKAPAKPKDLGSAKHVGTLAEKVEEVGQKLSDIAVKRAQRIHISAGQAGISEEKLRVRIAQINHGDVSAKALNDAQATALLKEIAAYATKKAMQEQQEQEGSSDE